MMNQAIVDIEFQNCDVVLFASGRKAIFLDGKFYFSEDWCYTTQDSVANTEIYIVEKIFRPSYYLGDAFRFLHDNLRGSHSLKVIYENTGKCLCCGASLE